MPEPVVVHIALPVARRTLPAPHTGLAVAQTGELLLCAGHELHAVQLDAEGWAWLADIAAGMSAAWTLENVTLPRLARQAAGNA